MTATSSLHLADEKAAMRKQHLAFRNALPMEVRIGHALELAEHGSQIPELTNFEPGTIIAGFNPIRSEIDPRPLMAKLAASGARLCLPVVTGETTLEFRELVRGAPMVETGFGTFGPDEQAAVLDPEIILVPLSVFDARGGRIGYGGGFYDRAIERLEQADQTPVLIGIAFSLQETDTVPMEKHDRYLDWVLTENAALKAEGNAQ